MSHPLFFLGTHHPHWLAHAGVPLFVSRRTLAKRKSFPRAIAPWALDSGGFTELQMHGRWTVTSHDYVAEVRRFRDEIGMLEWAAPQDWMCEEIVIRGGKKGGITFAGTKLSIAEHQRRTVDNLVELRTLAPDVRWTPVLQGWSLGEYLHCIELYARAGVDVFAEPLVGIGTVCRRQGTFAAEVIVRDLADDGIRLHAFGFKRDGLAACGDALASADSLAWSYRARRDVPIDGHEARHKNCANCMEYALAWRVETLAIERAAHADDQLSIFARGSAHEKPRRPRLHRLRSPLRPAPFTRHHDRPRDHRAAARHAARATLRPVRRAAVRGGGGRGAWGGGGEICGERWTMTDRLHSSDRVTYDRCEITIVPFAPLWAGPPPKARARDFVRRNHERFFAASVAPLPTHAPPTTERRRRVVAHAGRARMRCR